MHDFNRAIARRVAELEKRLKAIPILPTPEEQARRDERRLELCRAVLAGEVPADLTKEEWPLFTKIKESGPIFWELATSGALDGYGPDEELTPDGDDHDGNGVPAWRP